VKSVRGGYCGDDFGAASQIARSLNARGLDVWLSLPVTPWSGERLRRILPEVAHGFSFSEPG
jgi:hypothetical protein